MTVLTTEHLIDAELKTFVEQVIQQAGEAFRVYRETNTITANGTVGFIERVPGRDLLVSVNSPGPWKKDQPLKASATNSRATPNISYVYTHVAHTVNALLRL